MKKPRGTQTKNCSKDNIYTNNKVIIETVYFVAGTNMKTNRAISA